MEVSLIVMWHALWFYYNSIFLLLYLSTHHVFLNIWMECVCIKAIKFYLKCIHSSIANLIKKATHSCAYMPHASKMPQI